MSDREIMDAKGITKNNLVESVTSNIIEEIDEHIDNAIHWSLDDDNIDSDDLYELELKVKQQVLFSLIKKVTK